MIELAIERKFISENLTRLEVKEFLEKELNRAGCGEIDIQRTPLGTRVMIYAQRPGLVIGRKGSSIKKITDILEKKFKLDNPQVEVNEVEVPELNALIMADNIASAIERGIHFRRAAFNALRRIMEAGARGAQIRISGKLTGDRNKTVKFLDGYLKHCGEPATLYVKVGLAEASPKQGVLGVQVKIMPPGIKLPDDIEFISDDVRAARKAEREKLEELVDGPVEAVEAVDEEETPVPKKIKAEKVKRKKRKKKEEPIDAKSKGPEKKGLEEKTKTPKKGAEKKKKRVSKTSGDTKA